jgi:hypothetical protein
MMATTLARLLASEADRAALAPFTRPTLRNWSGIVVGRLQPTPAMADSPVILETGQPLSSS